VLIDQHELALGFAHEVRQIELAEEAQRREETGRRRLVAAFGELDIVDGNGVGRLRRVGELAAFGSAGRP
jgi:hypothetical protein